MNANILFDIQHLAKNNLGSFQKSLCFQLLFAKLFQNMQYYIYNFKTDSTI